MTVQYLLMILKKRNDAINVFLCQMDESSKVSMKNIKKISDLMFTLKMWT